MQDPMSWATGTLWLITAVNAILTLLGGFRAIMAERRRPEDRQNAEIAELRSEIAAIHGRLDQFSQYFTSDDERIKELEAGNRVSHQMLLALARHAIDGNHTDELKEASEAMDYYLVHGRERRQHN